VSKIILNFFRRAIYGVSSRFFVIFNLLGAIVVVVDDVDVAHSFIIINNNIY